MEHDGIFSGAIGQLTELGVSVEAIAAKYGVSSTTVRNWRDGKTEPGKYIQNSIYMLLYKEKRKHEKKS